jgi:hypothetical protein
MGWDGVLNHLSSSVSESILVKILKERFEKSVIAFSEPSTPHQQNDSSHRDQRVVIFETATSSLRLVREDNRE